MATVSIRTPDGVKDFRFITRDNHEVQTLYSVKNIAFAGKDVLYQTEEGDLYFPELQNFAYMPDWYSWTGNLLKCLIKLKLLTRKEMTFHRKWCKEANEKSIKIDAAFRMVDAAKMAGIDLTMRQLKQVAKLEASR